MSESPGALNQSLGDYVFFPLSYVFRQHQTFSDRVIELAIRIVDILVETCWNVDIPPELAKQLMLLITFVIGSGGSQATSQVQRSTTSEECKIAGSQCLETLFKAMKLSISAQSVLTAEPNLPAVGHSVSTLLEMLVESCDASELGRTSLGALAALLEAIFINGKDIVSSFLPGIISQLSRVLAPQSRMTRRAHTILSGALDLLGCVISASLSDGRTNAPTSKDGSQAWFTTSCAQVKVALEGILVRNRSHPKADVRRAVCSLCHVLLEQCTEALESSDAYSIIIDTLVILSSDDDSSLGLHSGYTLQTLAVSNLKISETLQRSLHGWVLSLTRVMNSQDEDMKVKLVDRITAGFRMFVAMGQDSEILRDMTAQNIRDSLESMWASSMVKERGVEVYEFASRDSLLSLRHSSATPLVESYPDIIARHQTHKDTIIRLKKLLEIIGVSSAGTVNSLVNTYIRDARDRSPISLWMAVNLLSSALSPESECPTYNLGGAQESLIQELFSTAHGILLDATTATAYLPMADTPKSTLLTCLALESLSLIASRQKSQFKEELVDSLYPIVHLISAPSQAVSHYAVITLNNISIHCGYPSPQDLVLDNIDYLVNAVALKLNTFDISPQALKMLGVMIRLTGRRILPFVDDLVESIFAALANYHGYERLCEDLFQVLRDVVSVGTSDEEGVCESKAIEQSPSAQAEVGEEKSRKDRIAPQELLRQFRIENLKRKSRRQEDINSETSGDGTSETAPQKAWGDPQSKKVDDAESYLNEELDKDVKHPTSSTQSPIVSPQEPTPTYKLIQSITRLTQHYLTHPSPLLRLQLLDLVTTSSPLLAKSEKEFLPLVNDVWPVLVERLFDPQPQVVVLAARAVKKLVGVCGEFISSRINDSWHRRKNSGAGGVGSSGEHGLCRLLEKAREQVEREQRRDRSTQAKKVEKLLTTQVRLPESGHSRVYSPAQQIWKALLDMLTSVVRECRLEEQVFDAMLEIVAGEFERGDQRELEEAMRRVNNDAVWLELQRRRGHVDRGWAVPEIDGVRFPEVVL